MMQRFRSPGFLGVLSRDKKSGYRQPATVSCVDAKTVLRPSKRPLLLDAWQPSLRCVMRRVLCGLSDDSSVKWLYAL